MQLNSGKASPLVFLEKLILKYFPTCLQSLIVTYYKRGVKHVSLVIAKSLKIPTHGAGQSRVTKSQLMAHPPPQRGEMRLNIDRRITAQDRTSYSITVLVVY